ncbi:fanciful K+ uptake-b family transporter [Raphidocelis subcapitata]|uniref:Fanciful K+ uptake-b family transporter n=1 Tax=Raphidocelis subcapitata TaxID=307507 RepID=A0A2V0NWF4_9CHLO|nr:fanciful K+ uptake-b family transporter [Raphidocelis subcapitata]|eukprot:GBF89893.1 fanciful K+ uptake-b family transporter [Raphidocelis subcapitata]
MQAAMGLQRHAVGVLRRSVPARPLCRRAAMRRATPSCAADASQWSQRLVSALQQQPAVLLAVQTAVAVHRAVSMLRDTVNRAFPQLQHVSQEDVKRQLARGARTMALLALPLARASTESLTAVYARTFEKAAFGFAKMYLFLLFMRVLLSWFPGIDWNAQPWTFLRLITEPYLQIYRGILPPLFGQLDFTPLFGFLILQDVVEVMAPTYTMGLHVADTSTKWTTSDVMCYLDGF